MKPIHIVSGIAVTAGLFGGAFWVKAKLAYDRDAREIRKLIAEYKAMGVPTNADEFFHRIPDSENAWVEVGPILLDKGGAGTRPLYHTGIAIDLILAGDRRDLPTMRRYLQVNQAKRDAITKALQAKPKFQVPHDYDEGGAVLLPEYASLKGLGKDYCLQAYAAWLEGKSKQAKADFDIANRLANDCTDRTEAIGALVGIAIHRVMQESGLRLVEVDPTLRPEVSAYFTRPGLFHEANIGKTLEGEFLMQVASWRYLDSPKRDTPKLPPPWTAPSEAEIERDAKVHRGDYIPQSIMMRRILLHTLTRWKPLLSDLRLHPASDYLPPFAELKATDISGELPGTLRDLVAEDKATGDGIYFGMSLVYTFVDSNQILWKALDLRATRGKYPASIQETGLKLRALGETDAYVLESSDKGVRIHSARKSQDTGKPVIQFAFPVSLDKEPPIVAKHVAALREYAAGKIDYLGNKIGAKK